MKTRSIASGFVVGIASLLGVIAQGCSAETGSPEAEIGSTSQAIVTTDVTLGTAMPSSNVLANAASCVIDNGSGTKYIAFAGGQDASGIKAQAWLFDGSTYYGPVSFDTNLSTGSMNGAMIARPGHVDQCLYFGGEDASGNKKTGIQLLTFSLDDNDQPTLTITNAGVLTTARSNHKVVPCGTDSVAVLAGTGASSTILSSIEVWHGQSGTTALPSLKKADESTNVTLNAARTEFAAPSVSATHFAVGGGRDSNGKLGSVEAFTVKDDLVTTPIGCKLADDDDSDAHYTLSDTMTARSSLGSFLTGTANQIAFVGGDTGSASKKVSKFTINWTVPASTTKDSDADDLATATIGPVVVKVPSGNAFALSGSVADLQESDATPWTTTTNRTGPVALPIRSNAIAELLNGSIYHIGGNNSGTIVGTVSVIAP